MTTYHDLTGFQRDLLQAIASLIDQGDTPYGLALKDWLDERYGEPIHHSRLYQNLDTLTEADLVTKTALDDRTNRYALTPAGKTLLDAHAQALARVSDQPVAIADGGDS